MECRNLIARYIKHQYNRKDISFDNLTLKFLQDLDYYLKVERGQQQSTINKHIQRVRKITKLAISEGYLGKDPFILYKPKRQENKVVYLTQEELQKLETTKIVQIRLEQVRDMFVFCCYTGLAYAEMNSLSKEHIVTGFDGNLWIDMYRKKTNSKVTVPLPQKAISCLERLSNVATDNSKILPEISNQKFNSYLKDIAEDSRN